MAAKEDTLVNLEREKQFLFSYRRKIRRGKKFIVRGNARQAIIEENIRPRIVEFDQNLFEEFETWEKEDIPHDFWFSPEGKIEKRSRGLLTYTDIKKMPPDSIKNREELWQLGEYSPFPNELEIVVYQGRPFHGYIKPREDLKSPFTRDNIIETLSCLPWKKYAE